MRKQQRFAFLAIGGLGLIAAIAPGLAAGLQVNTPTSGSPAAGQGSIDVQGFVVEAINWSVEDDGEVAEVTFDIFRTGDCTSSGSGDDLVYTCTEPSTVDDANATVRVSLTTSGGPTWFACDVAAGEAECSTSGIQANVLTNVEVLAFDSN